MAGGKASGADLGLLILRLALGAIFIAHGVDALLAENPVQAFSDRLADMGVPYASPGLAIAVISAAIGGGLLLALGLYARLGALAAAAILGVAILKVHWHNGFWLPTQVTEAMKTTGKIPLGYEYGVALLAMAVCILLAGPGKLAVLLGKKKSGGK